jgi:hypothetical protein
MSGQPKPITWYLQKRIWTCDACLGHPRVQLTIRQQTPAPAVPVRLLLVGVAPPYESGVCVRKVANSATNNPDDDLRIFIEKTLYRSWDDLVAKGLFLIHAVKCAIIPDEKGFQNPPNPVIDRCTPDHFAVEFELVNAPRVVVFGKAPLRATLSHPSVIAPQGVTKSKTLEVLISRWPSGISCRLGRQPFTLHVARFPRSNTAKKQASLLLEQAAQLAEL